ncbi:MAG: CHAD domain-containing protein [Limisphaerales bacterium]
MADDAAPTRPSSEVLMKFCIKRQEALPTAIRRIADEQLQLANRHSSGKKISATSIHSARKAIKRTRAVLQLLRSDKTKSAVREEDHALRDAARVLAANRDLHVQWVALKRLPICKQDGVCHVLRQRLLKAQTELKGQNADHIEQFNTAISCAQRRLTRWPTGELDQKQLALALKRSYRRNRKCFKRVREAPTGTRLHEWRKAAKTFWHDLELIGALTPKKLNRLSQNAHDLTQYLGDDHDLFLVLRALAAATDPETRLVKREIRKARGKLQRRAFKIARQTFDLAPSVFHERISRCLNQVKK